MKVNRKWRRLGWRHPLWDYVRFYSVVQSQGARFAAAWMEKLRSARLEVDDCHHLPVNPADVPLFFKYLEYRETELTAAMDLLRTEEEALAYCAHRGLTVTTVKTRNEAHHQSSAALVAAVGDVVHQHCSARGLTYVLKPARRCVWLVGQNLHVTARNLDGAMPSLAAPQVVWEIKEYWGKTAGGSKMSDAVYECQLVGRELREFEERSGASIPHVVFLDGKTQWTARKSDLKRFIDLFHQGIIDHLFIGREVETEWAQTLAALIP